MRLTVLFSAIFLAVFAMAISGGFAHAQQPPVNLTAANGAENGAVDLSWDAFPGVTNYTVGWLAVEDYEANRENNEWLKYFAYSNVGEIQEWTVRRLTPGIDYWLIACESLNDVAPGVPPQCTGWERLTVSAGPACPTAEEPVAQEISDGDYDADNDGLIEIRNIDQLDAMRYDLDGDGASEDDAYVAAFPNAATGMGCPGSSCTGYELVADLDFGSVISARGWEPIGNFNAVFDGNDHTISNLVITRSDTDYVGLFGRTAGDSVIQRIGLVSASITGGALVGSLVGSNSGAISDSYATGSVIGSSHFVGGLVGGNSGAISDSYATGSVSGSSRLVGGLVGRNFGAISDSYATGSAIGSSYQVGGLVGYSNGTITASYATGSATSSAYHVGGLVGQNGGTITASYATGSATGSSGHAGGLVGNNYNGTITASYATGSASATSSTEVGGLVGYNGGTITASYWDTQTSGLTDSDGGIGLTTSELQEPTGATGIYASWNASWWDFGTSEQYPVLKVEGLDVAAQRP